MCQLPRCSFIIRPLEFPRLFPVLGLDSLQVFDGVALGLMQAFQPLNRGRADALDQPDAVLNGIARQVAVALDALGMAVERLEPEFRTGTG